MDQKIKFHLASLLFSTVMNLFLIVVTGLANSPISEIFGFVNNTMDTSNKFYMQITPGPWSPITIWTSVYIMQIFWTVYEWAFLFGSRFRSHEFLSTCSLVSNACANACNIVWVYLWGNGYTQYCFSITMMLGVLNYLTGIFEAVFIHKNALGLRDIRKCKISLYSIRVVILNGIAMYTAYVTLAIALNFTIVLQYFYDVSAANAGTVGLSIMSAATFTYFFLDITIIDPFTRPIVMVYPVIIWAVLAIVGAHWDYYEDPETIRNNVFSLVLLIVAIALFILRIVTMVVFRFRRPM